MGDATYAKGLEGVIAAESEICLINGAEGKLYYRGYSIEDLAKSSTFEEITYLLLYEKLPTESELSSFQNKMRKSRPIDTVVQNMITQFPEKGSPMELLQSVITYLSSTVSHTIHHSDKCNCRDTLHQIAQLATVLAMYQRVREGKSYVAPREDLSHGANFLYMMRGEEPDPAEGAIMDKCLILHAEHGFNASTFTARVVASTLSTCYCSISAAVGALYGSLHGGANERVLDMVDAIGSLDNVESWIDKAMAEHKKVMGIGHRVYKAKDPRATVIEEYLKTLSENKGDSFYLDMLTKIEATVNDRMKAEGKLLFPNVDFFSGAVYSLLGIPRDLFTPIFAISRVSGWLTHILEQRKDNRIYRPKCLYEGPQGQSFVPIEDR